jgi:hypothetical protein
MIDPSESQPRDEGGVSYFSFKPWETIQSPILMPGELHSFWTIVYSGVWFDNEPKFLYFTDANISWWEDYYAWLRGEGDFPGDNPSRSRLAMSVGSGVIALGLFPLFLTILGVLSYLKTYLTALPSSNGYAGKIKMSVFPVLFICNAAGIIAVTLRLPVYSAMKASYFLISMPAFAVFIALGIMALENWIVLKMAVSVVLGALFALVSFHILHILSFFMV